MIEGETEPGSTPREVASDIDTKSLEKLVVKGCGLAAGQICRRSGGRRDGADTGLDTPTVPVRCCISADRNLSGKTSAKAQRIAPSNYPARSC